MKCIAFASSLFAIALAAGAAHAQAPLDGSAVAGGNVVGGGGAIIAGGGDDMTIIYNTGGAGGGGGVLLSQPGWPARITSNSDGPQVEYLGTAPANAGREAWIVGGGDNAEVVYRRPR
jgi:hypothetical protein